MTTTVHEVSAERLRSERVTSVERSQRLAANHAAAIQRRGDLDAALRAELLLELGPKPSATQLALVDAAVSAHVEIAELSSRFRRALANENTMWRLSRARAQLTRILAALGLPRPPGEPDAPPEGATLEEQRDWAQRYVRRRLAEVRNGEAANEG